MALDIRAPLVMAQPPRKVDFAHDIVPLLKARCGECHTGGKYKGSFSLGGKALVFRATDR
jgi:hypothetical protein